MNERGIFSFILPLSPIALCQCLTLCIFNTNGLSVPRFFNAYCISPAENSHCVLYFSRRQLSLCIVFLPQTTLIVYCISPADNSHCVLYFPSAYLNRHWVDLLRFSNASNILRFHESSISAVFCFHKCIISPACLRSVHFWWRRPERFAERLTAWNVWLLRESFCAIF